MSKNTISPLQLLYIRNYPDSINMIQSSPAELSSNLEPSWSILCYLEALKSLLAPQRRQSTALLIEYQ